MNLTIGNSPSPTPTLARTSGLRLVAAAPALWRIVGESGRVLGHLQEVGHGHDVRYRARRFHAPSRAFRDLGEFWSAADAVECVAFAR